jgi:hypothetical protein
MRSLVAPLPVPPLTVQRVRNVSYGPEGDGTGSTFTADAGRPSPVVLC